MQIRKYIVVYCIFMAVSCGQNKTKKTHFTDTLNKIDAKGYKQGYWEDKDTFPYEKLGIKKEYILYHKYIDNVKQYDFFQTDTSGTFLKKVSRSNNITKIYDKNNVIIKQDIELPKTNQFNSKQNVFSIGYFDFSKGLISHISQGNGFDQINISFYKNGGIKEITESLYYARGVINQSVQKKFDENGCLLQLKDYGYDNLLVDEVFFSPLLVF